MKPLRTTLSILVAAGVVLPAGYLYENHIAIRGLRNMDSGSLALEEPIRAVAKPNRNKGKAEARKKIADGRAGTYIEDILIDNDSALARWRDRTDKPIRVYIDEAPELTDWNPAFTTQIRGAFKEWSVAGVPLRFSYVPAKRDADVIVQFITKFAEPISGKTVWTRNDQWWIVDGRITIALRRSTGDPLSENAIRAIALHEVGHLVGLDHAKNDANIMAPRVRVKTLSEADRATLQLLYSLEPGSLR